ncbi:MAG: DUF2027 domain-containing protein [Bacteroidales bacterium]|nr:DUF2027 domain-containing protein [Bacteroidales bacterium]
MGFSKGDKVKFLNDVGSGIITRTDGDKRAYVMVEDGFEIPYNISELLLVEASAEIIPDKEDVEIALSQDDVEEESVDQDEDKQDTGTFEDLNISGQEPDNLEYDEEGVRVDIALIHANQNDRYNSDIDIYMINDSNYHILYNISEEKANRQQFIQAGVLEPQIKVHVAGYKQKVIEKAQKFCFQLLFFRKGVYSYIPPQVEIVELTKSNLVQEKFVEDNPYFDEPAQIIHMYQCVDFESQINMLSSHSIQKVIDQKDNKRETKLKPKENRATDIEEVDLHIHAIVDTYAGLSNGEILQIQMDRFQTALEGALLHKTKKIVFIHGVGNGKLKYELKKVLDNKYPDLKYQDASFKEYGYGATMVLLKAK